MDQNTNDKVSQYRQCIRQLLANYAQVKPAQGDIEVQLLIDTEHDHYQLVDVGWVGHRRIHSCLMHLDIKDGKVWIQRNQTDELIAEQLVELGVDRNDIVLGLQPPYARPYTGYSVA
jgi:hypothetical protein